MPRKIYYFEGRRIREGEIKKGEKTRQYRRRKAGNTSVKKRKKGEKEII
jgi:hypothetical protein